MYLYTKCNNIKLVLSNIQNITLPKILYKVNIHSSPRLFHSVHFKSMDPQKVAVVQMTSSSNKDENFKTCQMLVEGAAKKGAKMVFFPEGCDYIAESKINSIELAEPLTGLTLSRYGKLAKSQKMWLSVGGIHIKEVAENKIKNSHFIINSEGEIITSYVKTHLFNVCIPDRNLNLQESTFVEAGNAIESPVMTVCGLVGLGICYDMRFPEFSLLQRKMGAQILTFPSAFTVHTGLAHWHTLLRARAIENQCYVIAAAQVGQHNSKRSSYGHALIIDPWGKILCEVDEGTGIAVAEIDLSYIEKIRSEMPVLSHRRTDLYALTNLTSNKQSFSLVEVLPFPQNYISYKFGQVVVSGGCIFLKTLHSQAFTNKKPFSPGHVLVTPEKPVNRYSDLSQPEISDLAQTIVLTLNVLRRQYEAKEGVQIAIQDGTNAGQTINHVHVHIVPMQEKCNSLASMYEIESDRKWREEADMEEEASVLRHLVQELQDNNLWLQNAAVPSTISIQEPQFGYTKIVPKRIILFSEKSVVYLPSNPILQGHTHLRSCKSVASLSELTPTEVTDLFLCVQLIQKSLENYYAASSSTIFIADGVPGIEELVVHVIPRKENDLKASDEIYMLLQAHNIQTINYNDTNLMVDEDLAVFLRKITKTTV